MTISDDTLMAYADGELDAASSNEVELAMLKNPALASKVAQHQQLRASVFAAFAPVLGEPVPARLQALLPAQPDTVVQLAAARADKNAKVEAARQQVQKAQKVHKARHWSWPEWGSLAAMLVVGVMVGRITMLTTNNDATLANAVAVGNDGGLIASGKLAAALSQQLASTAATDASVKIGVSFVAKEGVYCRSFALDGSAGLACKDATQWKIPLMVETLASNAQAASYRQAASSIPPAVLEAIDQRIAGKALDAEAEQLAKEHGWKH